jgi:hypothetical protein
MFWDEVQDPDQTRGVQASLVSGQSSRHSPKKSTNLHQKEKGSKSQNDLNFHSILHSRLDGPE